MSDLFEPVADDDADAFPDDVSFLDDESLWADECGDGSSKVEVIDAVESFFQQTEPLAAVAATASHTAEFGAITRFHAAAYARSLVGAL